MMEALKGTLKRGLDILLVSWMMIKGECEEDDKIKRMSSRDHN